MRVDPATCFTDKSPSSRGVRPQ